jgi:8-oxo-dGTP pyrophosphatase MutT (NUDIX family)
MKAHAAQISLPGGMVEAEETAERTALREFQEELGADTSEIEIVGSLAPVLVFVSNFAITPIVAVCHGPLELRPNPAEVEEVVPVPLAQLLDPACQNSHLIRRGGLVFRAPCYAVAGRQVWGATSLILAEFAALVECA